MPGGRGTVDPHWGSRQLRFSSTFLDRSVALGLTRGDRAELENQGCGRLLQSQYINPLLAHLPAESLHLPS